MNKSSFDRLAADYEILLADPLRDRFTGNDSRYFYLRKQTLILDYFRERGMEPRNLSYLDVGCGKGILLSLMQDKFASCAGCDPSAGMLNDGLKALHICSQQEATVLPFADASFDFISTVCVLHHVEPPLRLALMKDIHRVLKPGGTYCLIEHNPLNPVTRLIVSRTPIDADAILLRAGEAKAVMQEAGFAFDTLQYFLYLPAAFSAWVETLEPLLYRVPFGGQYALFVRKE